MLDSKYEIHFAPLRGLTDTAFRRLHASLFGGVDFYYSPYLRMDRGLLRKKDLRELAEDKLPNLVSQILPGTADEVEKLCEPIVAHGGRRVDVYIGCPFPPVVAHGRGAALLNNADKLEDVLQGVRKLQGELEFSLKMRLGYSDPHQWEDVMDSINATSFKHVTLHPRFAKQQYRGECDRDEFDKFMAKCAHPVVYNGDLRTVEDVEEVVGRWPALRGVMIGRGLLADLSLARKLRGEGVANYAQAFKALHDGMLSEAKARMTDGWQVAEHMKPYWDYFCKDEDFHRELKAIRKSTRTDKYEAAAAALVGLVVGG